MFLINRRNCSYYRNEIGVPCYAAPISGDDRLIWLLYQESAMGLIAKRTKVDMLFCPRCLAPMSPTLPRMVIINDMNFRDIPLLRCRRAFVCSTISRVVTVSQSASRDDMKRRQRENCDDSRGVSFRSRRPPGSNFHSGSSGFFDVMEVPDDGHQFCVVDSHSGPPMKAGASSYDALPPFGIRSEVESIRLSSTWSASW